MRKFLIAALLLPALRASISAIRSGAYIRVSGEKFQVFLVRTSLRCRQSMLNPIRRRLQSIKPAHHRQPLHRR